METQKQIPDKVLKKLGKLLNLTEGAKQIGSMHEAELAAQKAQEILMEYNLSLEDVGQINIDDSPKVGEDHIKYEHLMGSHEGDWVASLYGVIAAHNLCRVLIRTTRIRGNTQKLVILLGKQHNRQIVGTIVLYLIPQIKNLARKSWSEYSGHEKRNTFIRGFLSGCIRGIDDKLIENEIALAAANNKVTGLIHIAKDAISEYLREKGMRVRQTKAGRRSGADGWAAGEKAAGQLKFNREIN